MAYLLKPGTAPACWRDGRGALRCSSLGAVDLPTGSGGVPKGTTPLQMLVAQVNRFADPRTPAAFRFIDGVGGGTFASPPKSKVLLDPTDPDDRRIAVVVAAIAQRRDAEAFSSGVGDGSGFDLISDFLANIQNTVTGRPGTSSPPIISTPPPPLSSFGDPVGTVNRDITGASIIVQGMADAIGLPPARLSIFGDLPMAAIGAVAIGGAIALFVFASKRKGKR